MGHTVLKLPDVIDRIKSYNFYLEYFSLGGQTMANARRDTQ